MADTNRISILHWREVGDDDDSVEVSVYHADDTVTPLEDALDLSGIDYEITGDELKAIGTEIIVIHQQYIKDGDEMQDANGRRFQIRIQEIDLP
jgi:hypothetical protein